jgi:hypothetical protein
LSGPDVVFAFTPELNGMYTFQLHGDLTEAATPLEVAIAVFSGPSGNLTEIVSQSSDQGSPPNLQRTRAFLMAGERYTILAAGHTIADTGPMELRVEGPYYPDANDTCRGQNDVAAWRDYR